MAMFANGEEYKEIGYSNFASQRNDPNLMRAVQANRTTRVSDSLVGAPLATGNLQPTAGAVGFTDGYNNATGLGKMILGVSSVAVGLAFSKTSYDLFKFPAGGLLGGIVAGGLTFVGGSYVYETIRGG